MILKFATKRNGNGNRRYFAINTETREYARESEKWFCREDFSEISYKDMCKIIQQCIDNGFSEVSYM